MTMPQIIDIQRDSVIVMDGNAVINDTTQLPIAPGDTSIGVDVMFYDITNDSNHTISGIYMTYIPDVDFWKIDVADIDTVIGLDANDGHKYIAQITEDTGLTTVDLRPFKLNEFVVENRLFEDTVARMAFDVNIGTGKMRWWDGATPGAGTNVYEANVYQDGTGTTPATSVEKVTHRGPITKV